MKILVTGGAGYIGSHMVAKLVESGIDTVVLDNLEKGHEKALLGGKLYKGDIRDPQLLDKIFTENKIDGVIHFAAYSIVPESVAEPLKYYDNNLMSTLALVTKMKQYGVNCLVSSSTAAVYGEPQSIPITEDQLKIPKSPYGESKLAIEKALEWFDKAYGIKYVALRYFNAAGAHPDGRIGEDHKPETHLIPLLLQTIMGKRESFSLFGEDYPTPDGTCIRDYVHVDDLAEAHLLAINSLLRGGDSSVYNLGTGTGYSNLQLIEAAKSVTGKPLNLIKGPRRPGDPAILIASFDKVKRELGWEPKQSGIEYIMETAWRWHVNHPDGY